MFRLVRVKPFAGAVGTNFCSEKEDRPVYSNDPGSLGSPGIEVTVVINRDVQPGEIMEELVINIDPEHQEMIDALKRIRDEDEKYQRTIGFGSSNFAYMVQLCSDLALLGYDKGIPAMGNPNREAILSLIGQLSSLGRANGLPVHHENFDSFFELLTMRFPTLLNRSDDGICESSIQPDIPESS